MERFDSNYFVEAGAGAGKTYTLVKIITDLLIEQGQAPSEIVAITFTNKSTQEMYTRVTAKLEEMLRDAKDSGDEARCEKIQEVLFKVPEIQISTIHSFCEKMLRTMQFESELGEEVEQIDNLGKELKELLGKTHIQKRFDPRLEQLGVGVYSLAPTMETLLNYPESEVLHDKFDSVEMLNIRKLFKDNMDCIHAYFHKLLLGIEEPLQEVFTEDFRRLLLKPELTEEECFEYYSFLNTYYKNYITAKYQPQYGLLEYLKGALNTIKTSAKAESEALALMLDNLYKFSIKNKKYNWVGTDEKSGITASDDLEYAAIHAFIEVGKDKSIIPYMVHSLAIPTLVELAKEYEQDYRKRGLATKNDMLKYARNMLQKSETARQYFHNKYKKIFVDEFQDTDDIQVQLLFYLASKEFNNNWKECILEDETLFVVGDPKQAIYRFRGADFSLYSEVRSYFEGQSNCSIEVKRDNYRSQSKICDFVDQTFGNDEHSLHLSGHNHQASYTSMVSKKDEISGSGIYTYDLQETKKNKAKNIEGISLEEDEITKISCFIKKAVDDRAAEYKDFLIITNKKSRAQKFGKMLDLYDIPCNLTGAIKYNEIQAISNLIKIFQFCDRKSSNMLLTEVLIQVYGVSYDSLRRLLLLIDQHDNDNARKVRMTDLIYKLDAIKEYALEKEEIATYKSMVELKIILDKSKKMREHPIALFEYIINGGGNIYQDEKDEYNQVSVFLSKMKEYEDLDSSTFTTKMLEVADTNLENQIILDDNRVRIMNLHKSKGLEGKIVILSYTKETSEDKKMNKYTSYYDRGNNTLDICVPPEEQLTVTFFGNM